jgi:uncharacterized membrane protein YbhN (UPF0104 family)
VIAVGVITLVAVRVPGAADDARAVVAHPVRLRPIWLGVAVAAEGLALAGGAAAQHQLLGAGARLGWPTIFGLVTASTGLAKLMPAGPITGAAWQAREYSRRGADTAVGVWAVLAGGFAATIAALGLLLAGAAIAGIGSLPLLACAAGVLAAAAAGVTSAARRASRPGRSQRWHRHPLAILRVAASVAELARRRAGFRRPAGVLAWTIVALLADAGVLAACFGLAGLPVPWRGLLFAYASGQLAGRLVPLPGGLGGVEGGVLGALTLTGTPAAGAAAAVIVYRVAGYWAIGATGTALAAALAHRRGSRLLPHTPQQPAADQDQGLSRAASSYSAQ